MENQQRGKRRDSIGKNDSDVSVNESPSSQDDGVIEGRNAVLEALRAGVTIDKVFIASGDTDRSLAHIASSARGAGAVVVETDRRKLDSMSITKAHQGVIALAASVSYAQLADIIELAKSKNEPPFIVICDGIEDPHNLGAIIRTSESAGAHGLVIPKRRSAGLSASVAKASSGAIYHLPIARVSNISSAIAQMKKAGIWLYAASGDGENSLWETDLTGPSAIVIGSEGSGISRLVRENCDFSVSIPMYGKITSLNASVSAALILYEAVKQRRFSNISDT
ncbi:MAG: 23S rRNA (guanosine(2251)-2'-O)-methyltransferase RlmB [Oscillospiraceae bacterium]|nr:23S rRNA (guanosine(2251)-2'-O)-methyltransferase RlmB [Oscillospiraceae bacterium]